MNDKQIHTYKHKKIFSMLIFFIILAYCFPLTSIATLATENYEATNINNSNTFSIDLQSKAAVLMEYSTGKTLYSKNSNQKLYPASITKIMTAIITLEKGNLSDKTTVSKTAISGIPSGYVSAFLSEGEIISVEDLLKILLIYSANDSANVLAEYISGSINDFVILMNNKAKEIGCNNTNFVTTNGIHDDNHYTTASDFALITQYCLKNDTFRKIISMKSCTIPATNKYEERTYSNTNNLISPYSSYYYESCIGGKTGYTSEAQNCLISACQKNGITLIVVILGASQMGARYTDSIKLYDYGFSNYSFSIIAEKSKIIDTIEIKNATSETKQLNIVLENDIIALINKSTQQNFDSEINLNSDIKAPISMGEKLGTISYNIDGQIYTENLIASHNVEKNDYLLLILRIALTIVLLIIIFIFLFKILNKRKYNKKNNEFNFKIY